MKSLRICFVAGTLGRGGAERQLIYMLRALNRTNVATRVICLTRGEAFEREIKELGITVEWVGSSHRRSTRLVRIVQALRREPADIVQSVHFYTNLYAAVAARILGIKEIGAIRSDVDNELKANGRMGPLQLRSPRHLIANSNVAITRAIAHGIPAARLSFVPNAVDTDWLTPTSVPSPKRPLRILFAGRLTNEKRPDRFVRVAANIMRRLPGQPMQAVVAGDGPLKSELTALAGSLGLTNGQFEVLGERNDMRDLYRDVDILMLTSDWEGTPNVILEAMACGVAVVATRVGGVAELVDGSRGLTRDPEDEDGLAQAAIALINDVDARKKLGACAYDHVSRVHSLSALSHHLIDTYRQVLA